jgi:cellulose synthase/poly-beta-1,6-N-acetylglucosamine synthase-like glycosyltransferase
LMIHLVLILLGWSLVLCTIPGNIELALLTIGGILPSAKRHGQTNGFSSLIEKVAIVIPAHNEAGSIARCVTSLARCERPRRAIDVDIVVIADNCDDLTAEYARRAGARVIVRYDNDRRGKGFALQDAFERLLLEGYDGFVVIDADSVADSNLIAELTESIDAGADGAQARYSVLNTDASTRTQLMNVALMAFNVLRPRGRERLGLSVGIFGNGFALTRATIQAVPYDVHSVVEDLEYHLRLVRSGRRIAFADRTTVRADMPTGGRGASTQRARWEGGRLGMVTQAVPTLIKDVAKGNVRLIEPLLDLLLLPLGFHVLLLSAIVALPFAATRIYALCAIVLVAVHVGAAVVIGGGGRKDFAALLRAPLYVLWKLAAVPGIVRSASRNAEWVRTER